MSTFNERLAKAFTQEGHTVSIYTFSLQYPSLLFPGSTQYSTEPAPTGIDIKVLINSINPFNWIKVGNRLRREKPDIIVVRFWLPFMGPCFGTILRFAKKNRHSKVVCIADNVIPHEKRAGDKIFTRYFIKPVDAIITMSQHVLNDLKKFTSTTPASYIPHPLYDNFGDKIPKQEARAKLGIGINEKVLLFFGFIRTYKGLDILLDALALLKNDLPDIKLLVAGEFYENEQSYKEQIVRLGIADNLLLHTNFIADKDIASYFGAADLVVQPYRHATQSGVTPLAYHFEVPMIVTDVGGLAAMVPHKKAGLVAQPDAGSLAENIKLFFELGEDSFLPHLREEKKKYNWKKMVDEILKITL